MDTPQRKYAASEKGKAARARAAACYRASAKGKASNAARVARYAASEKGKAARARAWAKRHAPPASFAELLKRQGVIDSRGVMRMTQEELRLDRELSGLPWPVPANEYGDQVRRERAQMRARGIPVPMLPGE